MTTLRLAVRRYARFVGIILSIWAVATACAVYVLSQQRLASPFAKSYDVRAEFENLTGVVPGLGLPVNVAGVKVGQISGIDLRDGRALATLRIDPDKLPHVYRDARAALIPNTLLKDMRINLAPGSPKSGVLEKQQVIPSGRTTSPLDLDELLASLDTDTRTWFTGLMADLGTGLDGRGRDLKRLLAALGPTAAQARRIGDLLAERRHTLPRLVHDLSTVTRAAGSRDRQLAGVVTNGNRTLRALAGQEQALRTSLARLPGTLDLAGGTLRRATRLTDELGPALDALQPTVRNLPRTLRDTRTLFSGGTLLPVADLQRFVDAAQPLAGPIGKTVRNLTQQTPALIKAFKVLEYTVDELAYDPPGGKESILYFLPWFFHNANSVMSTADANGVVVRGLTIGSCATFTQPGVIGQIGQALLGSAAPCGSTGGGG